MKKIKMIFPVLAVVWLSGAVFLSETVAGS